METEEEKNNNNKNIIVTVLVLVGVYVFFAINTSLDKNKALLSPTTRQEIEEIGIKEKAEADRKKEEAEKAKVQAEEDKRNTQAEKYCSERKKSYRRYPILDDSIDKNSSISYENFKDKIGNQLTNNDCKKIIAFMYKRELKEIDSVAERKYWIGMSSLELTLSAGFYDDVNTDNYGDGEREQRIYKKDSYGINAMYFYVEKGKVTSYQDF